MIRRPQLVMDCPIRGMVPFSKCKTCDHKTYESITEYAIECNPKKVNV